ncbi:hypothetical protein FHEFKHOI_00571 [Candidatus Methanoperedenaceae archaeon GB50]|nr:hypothetical protein AIOGIFDO_00569 [Candidatus Methanoperedenaceae archaeon GB37]CAD7769299.1 hypothetical protein FHEFKHOI_00571 [Candidatus Methanoperedenaceae archaeon GB50]
MKELIDTTKDGFSSMNTRMRAGFNKLAEGQEKMLEKQDSLIRLTEEGFSDVESEMKTGFMEVKEEVHLLRDDFRELFMEEVKDLRGEIAEIKATLARMQG